MISQMGADHISRRPRADVVLAARFRVGDEKGEGEIGNLSLEGLFLCTPVVRSEGELIEVEFTTPNGRVITVAGSVRWSASLGFGVELSDFGDDYRIVAEDYLQGRDPTA